MNYAEPPIHPVSKTDGRLGYQTTGEMDFYWRLGASGLKVERVGTIQALTFENCFELRLDAQTGSAVKHEDYNHVLNLLLIAAGEI